MLEAGKDIKVFTGVMDADTESRFVKDGNYRKLLNARNTINSEGKFGSIEDLMGNVLVGNPYLQYGRNKCVGTYEDIAGQSCIFFVWNENGYHGIFRWFSNKAGYDNGVIEKIYQVAKPDAYDKFNPNPLGFEEDKLITGVDLVGDLLFWTNGSAQPKCINIARANETNKKRKFNVYFNRKDLSNASYTIDLYFEGTFSPVYSFSWSDTDTTVEDKVNSFISAVNSDPSTSAWFKAENMVNYAIIELSKVGVYYVDFIRNGNRTDFVTANNFYPDFINATQYSFEPLHERVLNRIKCPPTCSPNVEFVEYPEQTTQNKDWIIKGDWTYTENSFNPIARKAYINLPNTSTYSPLSCTLTITYTITKIQPFTSGVANFNIYAYNGTVAPLQPPNPNYFVYSHYQTHGDVYGTFTQTINFQLTNTQPTLFLYITMQNATGTGDQPAQISISGDFNATFTENGNASYFNTKIKYYNFAYINTNPSYYYFGMGDLQYLNNDITNNSYMFRGEYQYLDNEFSVWGASSNVAIPYNINTETAVNVDFSSDEVTNSSLSFQLKQINLAVSSDGGVNWSVFKSLNPYYWSGDNCQQYYFTGKELLTTIPSAEALLEYHDVPIKSKSQSFIDSRIFDGGMEKGYDKVKVDFKLTPRYLSLSDPIIVDQTSLTPEPSLHFWKRGWEGYIGIVYYDDADRKSGVCLANDNKFKISYYNDDTVSIGPAVVDWEIYSEPPSWATKYQWVRTNNLVCVDSLSTGAAGYLMYAVNNVKYIDELGASVALSAIQNAKYTILNFDNLTFQKAQNSQVKINFTFQKGDIVRVIFNKNGDRYSTSVIEFDIKSVLGGDVYIENNLIPIQEGSLVEIYSPLKQGGEPLFYEFGECYKIESSEINGIVKKYHTGSTSNQSYGLSPQNIVTPATGTMNKGDVYYFNRIMPYSPNPIVEGVDVAIDRYYKDALGNTYVEFNSPTYNTQFGLVQIGWTVSGTNIPDGCVVVDKFTEVIGGITHRYVVLSTTPSVNGSQDLLFSNKFSLSKTLYISSPSVNDNSEQYFTGNYRTNIKDLPGRTELPSTIDFSDQWISNQVNGLCAVQPANQQIYDTVYGRVERMMVVNNDVLKLIFSNSYQLSVYVNQGIIRQTQGGDNIISQSDQVAGNSHLIQRTLGTTNAECVALNDEGDVMGYDENEGVAWRASGNGLIQISDHLQKSTFKGFSNRRRLLDRAKSECPSVYDLYHDEYIITLGNLQPQAQVFPKATINLFDLDPAVTVNLIQIRVMPNNTLIYSGGITGLSLNTKISDAFTAQGWVTSTDENGVTVSAPTMAYANATMVVTITYDGTNTKTYTASFNEGTPQGTGEPFEAVTICYNKQEQGWTSYYSFTPEFYGRVRDFIVSFKDGQMWLHDKGSLAKNFYGVQYSREFTFVSHKDFPKVKVFKGININGIGKNSVVADVEPYEGMSGMLSYLPVAAFKTLEGIQYAAFMRDRLTPGFSDPAVAMLNGRQLRGQTMNIKLNNTDTSKSLLYSTEIVYFYSENS